jgi:3-methyladenine DNA glycosylase AlkD
MSTDPAVEAFVQAITGRLADAAEPATKQWWERYMKDAASFRGVKMATTRRIVDDVRAVHRIDVNDADVVLGHFHRCVEQPWTEDKLAGVLLLAEHGLCSLDISHVDELARPLADGSLADWNVVDWYCVKVLGPFVVAGVDAEARCHAIADWVHADVLWQRRAGIVAFVNHASTDPELFHGFTDLLVDACATNVADPIRWSQTSVGWVLRELAKRVPDRVQLFVDSHPELSAEARKNALKHL